MDEKYKTPTGFSLGASPATMSELKHFNLSCDTLPLYNAQIIDDVETLRDFTIVEAVGDIQSLCQEYSLMKYIQPIVKSLTDENVFMKWIIVLNTIYGCEEVPVGMVTKIISEVALRAAQDEKVIVFDECFSYSGDWLDHLRGIPDWSKRAAEVKKHYKVLSYADAITAINENKKQQQEEDRKLSIEAKEAFKKSCINFQDMGINTDMLSNQKNSWMYTTYSDFQYALRDRVNRCSDTDILKRYIRNICTAVNFKGCWIVIVFLMRDRTITDEEISQFMLSLLYFNAKYNKEVIRHNDSVTKMEEVRERARYLRSTTEIDEFADKLIIYLSDNPSSVNTSVELSVSDADKIANSFEAIYSHDGMSGVVNALLDAVSTMPKHILRNDFCNLLALAMQVK